LPPLINQVKFKLAVAKIMPSDPPHTRRLLIQQAIHTVAVLYIVVFDVIVTASIRNRFPDRGEIVKRLLPKVPGSRPVFTDLRLELKCPKRFKDDQPWRCPSGGRRMPLLPAGRSIEKGWEDGQADKKNAEPMVAGPASPVN
jgi:hypothetical protein